MNTYLSKINSPADIKNMSKNELRKLSQELRKFLVHSVSKTGGHLAPNLGTVELSVALHHVFSTPKDKIVWDVGHQSYVHKILTGRAKTIRTATNNGGISGFPRLDESEHDAFGTGHSSTSISAALGLAKAMELSGDDKSRAIAVIGDGSLTGGMAFEALNNAGHTGSNIVVILNDNQMSICKNVGSFSRYLNRFRAQPLYNSLKKTIDTALNKIPKIGSNLAEMAVRLKGAVRSIVLPTTIFEELGFKYIGPIDGHSIDDLLFGLKTVRRLEGPVLLHVVTTKGKGYRYAENQPDNFHSVGTFDIKSGIQHKPVSDLVSADNSFGEQMCILAQTNKKLVAIDAAMTKGTGLMAFRERYPDRFFDVGIAEQHAVTFAAGLAASGFKPVVAIYSSFMQRAYDQILHDVALQNLPVVLMLPSSGLNRCGSTHHGIFDLSFLSSMPNISILAPSSTNQLVQMLKYATQNATTPIAIRYPQKLPKESVDFEFGKAQVAQKGEALSLFCIGDMLQIGLDAAKLVPEISVEIIDVGTIAPLDTHTLSKSLNKTGCGITLESNCVQNGAGTLIQSALNNFNIHAMGFDRDNFPQFATLEDCNLDSKSVAKMIQKMRCTSHG
ncbi:1-deoxy-D-xylulose-5-phosphate synthase 1 [Clostridia bacterium]|nr:1-deoxy-D-xylulose-5-phosphate synthase 1 [Clostridia bacterium]